MLQRLVSKLVYTWKYNSLISLLVFIAYLETIGRKIYICNIQQNFIWFFTQVILSHGLIFQKIWKRVKDFLLTSNGILVQAVVNFASFTSCKTARYSSNNRSDIRPTEIHKETLLIYKQQPNKMNKYHTQTALFLMLVTFSSLLIKMYHFWIRVICIILKRK